MAGAELRRTSWHPPQDDRKAAQHALRPVAQAPAVAGQSVQGASRPARPGTSELRLGTALLRGGVVSASALMEALVEASRRRASLPRLLRGLGLAKDRELAEILAETHAMQLAGPELAVADPRLVAQFGAGQCMQHGVVPLRRAGAVTLVGMLDPVDFKAMQPMLVQRLGPVVPVVMAQADFERAVERAGAEPLRRKAESSVNAAESCRSWDGRKAKYRLAAALTLLGAACLAAPVGMVLGLLGLLLMVLILSSCLRLAAAFAALGHRAEPALPRAPNGAEDLPVVSVMVPLFNEPAIAPRLVARLGALDYPRDRLDIMLVVEQIDMATREALAAAALPGWMRVIEVPDSPLRTKPRALNYALNLARGSLIGVYDAEDAPDRDQLRRVAAAFATGGPSLACVQGVLDYYNPETNWLSRCFTIEYAAWFRLVLTGFARLGLVIPLGGTTLFFRRDILEELGGWDAHNVTEDADLGVRLARRGYRTDLLHTVTQEEANCRALPWIKQRSRWLKGYAMTYCVHMRSPLKLWRDLGTWRFFGYQILFLGTLIQFLLAPLFWTLWLLILGLDLPLAQALPPGAGMVTLMVLLIAEVIAITINLMALRTPRHRRLRPWVLTLSFYFPLATLAAYKAVWEMLSNPFYWDKTTHGVDDHDHLVVAVCR